MDFFHSLTLDMKLLVVAIAGCAVLALFSGNRTNEKRYLVVLVLLAGVGFYRFTHAPGDAQHEAEAAQEPAKHFVKAPDRHVPIESTAAKRP